MAPTSFSCPIGRLNLMPWTKLIFVVFTIYSSWAGALGPPVPMASVRRGSRQGNWDPVGWDVSCFVGVWILIGCLVESTVLETGEIWAASCCRLSAGLKLMPNWLGVGSMKGRVVAVGGRGRTCASVKTLQAEPWHVLAHGHCKPNPGMCLHMGMGQD